MPTPAQPHVRLITTGGTIAGWATDASQQHRYQAGALSGAALLEALPAGAQLPLPVQLLELARINSKDADTAFWVQLVQTVQSALLDSAVAGIAITHGTDTLEETAFLLAEMWPQPVKPIVLVSAMRPASHPEADGPANLLAALQLAADTRTAEQGVVACIAGLAWRAAQLQKIHGHTSPAFISRAACERQAHTGAAGADGVYAAGVWQWQPGPVLEAGKAVYAAEDLRADTIWPEVEIVHSYAASSAYALQAMLTAHRRDGALDGLILAGTGFGTLHQGLEPVLSQLQAEGVQLVLATQCLGSVRNTVPDGWLCWPGLSPRQARVRLMLQLLA